MRQIVTKSLFVAMACACLAGCGDRQSTALEQLSALGYSLSVMEFHRAAVAGDAEALELFCKAGTTADVKSPQGRTALMNAAAAGRTSAVEKLIALGANTSMSDNSGRSVAMEAAAGGSVRVLQLLESSGMGIKPEEPLLMDAARAGHLDMVHALIPHYSHQVQGALEVAVTTGKLEAMEALLKAGASVFEPNKQGDTPLILACVANQESSVEYLLNSGAKRLVVGSEGRYPLLCTTNPQVASLLSKPPSDGELDPPHPPLTLMEKSIGPADKGLPVVDKLRLITVREAALPFILRRGAEGTFQFEDLTRTLKPFSPEAGRPLGQTGWRVTKALPDDAQLPPWMLGTWIVKQSNTGVSKLAVPDLPIRSGKLVALVQLTGRDGRYEASVGDEVCLDGQGTPTWKVQAITHSSLTLSHPTQNWRRIASHGTEEISPR